MQKRIVDDHWIFGSIFVAGLVMLIASFVLSVEAIELAKDPQANLACNINPVISCGTVAKHPSASILGFPNSFIGMVAAPVVMFLAFMHLIGIRYPRWVQRIAMAGFLLGMIFASWMFYMSYIVIGVLCPWCLTVTVSMLVAFFSYARFMIREGALDLPKKISKSLQKIVAQDYDKALLIMLLVIMAAAILSKYGASLFATY